MIYLDTEDFDTELVFKHGTYKYTSTCEVMVISYAYNDEPVQVWDITSDPSVPEDLYQMIVETDDPIICHNSMFDRNVMHRSWLRTLQQRGSPNIGAAKQMLARMPIPRWRCSMVRALAHGLPGGLDALCGIFKVSEEDAKIKDGRRLVNLFCRPQDFKFAYTRADYATAKEYKAAKEAAAAAWPGRATKDTHPEDWAAFLEYAKGDIRSMRVLDGKVPRWNYNPAAPWIPDAPDFADIDNPTELELYFQDQRINDRGIQIDVDLAQSALRAVSRRQAVLKEDVQEHTDGAVESATKSMQLLAHICETYGITLPNLKADTLERRINDPDLPQPLKDLLIMRLDAATASVAKYKAVIKAVSPDGRVRGTMQFNGASRTRRWAHRGMQPGNLPRPTLKQSAIEQGIEWMKHDIEDVLADDVMALASSAVRGMIVPSSGRKLVVPDLANIEGRAAAWLAGEGWKLQAFRDYDTVLGKDGKWYSGPEYYAAVLRGEYIPLEEVDGEPVRKGHDLYKLAYANSFRIDPKDVTKSQRQIGKTQELMLGYGGGVGAFVTGAAAVKMDLVEMTKQALPVIPPDVLKESRDFLKWIVDRKGKTHGLADDVFVACESIKRLWRRAHPATSSLWKEQEDIVRTAIESPGKTFTVRKMKIRRDGAWLRVRLPSGRYLCYLNPQVDGAGKITYLGLNQYTRKWERIYTYSGKIFENECQGLAGDFMKANMPRIEAAGYDILFTVHDELPSEADDEDRFNETHMSALLAYPPTWAEGMPLAAAGFSAYRYRKD